MTPQEEIKIVNIEGELSRMWAAQDGAGTINLYASPTGGDRQYRAV